MFENMEPSHVKFIFFIILFACMSVLETSNLRRVWTHNRSLRIQFHILLSLINSILINITIRIPLVIILVYVHEFEFGLSNKLGINGLIEVFITIILLDFIEYWWHRFNHNWSFLWRFHKVHHMDTFIDTTTALRFHIGELFLSNIFKIIFIIAWGPSPWSFFISEILITSFSQFHHSNIKISESLEKKLRRYIMTPFLHWGHHSFKDNSRNKNFSTTIIIWDKFFGSYHEPNHKDIEKIGIPEDDGKNIFTLDHVFNSPFNSNK